MRERDIEKHFNDCVKKRNGEVRKVKWIAHAHAPDRLALLPSQHFLVEFKATGKGPSTGQLREHERLRAAGFEVRVFASKYVIDDFFYHYDRGFRP